MDGVVWVDLTVEDAARARDFYARVLGWRPEPVPMGGYADFNMLHPDTGAPAAGLCHARGANQGIPPVWLVYFAVPDLEVALAEVEAGGGETLLPPRGTGSGRYAVVRDPAGAVFAVADVRRGAAAG